MVAYSTKPWPPYKRGQRVARTCAGPYQLHVDAKIGHQEHAEVDFRIDRGPPEAAGVARGGELSYEGYLQNSMDPAKKMIVCHEGLQVDSHPGLRIEDMRSLHVSGLRKAKAGQERKGIQVPPQAVRVKSNHRPQKMTFSTGPNDSWHANRCSKRAKRILWRGCRIASWRIGGYYG